MKCLRVCGTWGGGKPVRKSRHYLAFDIFLYVLPFLAILGRARGQQLGEIARLDIGEGTTIFDGIVIFDD